MTASKSSSPIVNLKAGVEIFPVKKTILLENLGLFRDSPSLLDADVYEIQSRVPLPVHAMFVNIVEGGPIILSDESCESLRLLAEEFRFEALLVECASFMVSRRRRSWFESGEECQHSGHRRVTLIVDGYSRTFESLNSVDEVQEFVRQLVYVKQDDIAIDGNESSDNLLEKAVAAVYSNTIASFPDGNAKGSYLAFILWTMQESLCLCSIDSSIYCLNRFHEIAPTDFDKARLLLLSQCDPLCPDKFCPLPKANWGVIKYAIGMLKREKNGKKDDAKALLLKLRGTELCPSAPFRQGDYRSSASRG
jgi:hypothetical protein